MGQRNEINIIYDIKEYDKIEGRIKIFGKDFVNNNKNKCKIIINDKENELIEEYNIKDNSKDKLEIKLIDIDNITNMCDMFYECSSLSNLPDISKWNTNNVNDMSCMFYQCSSLSNLQDFSKWYTNNDTDMSSMFYKCSSLLNIPDISKWNTNYVTDISSMFDGCSSL